MFSQLARFNFSLWLIIYFSYITYLYSSITIYVSDYHVIFIHSSTNGHLGFPHILAIVHNAAKNKRVHISFLISVFLFFAQIIRSGIAGSYDSSIFNFLRTSIMFSIVTSPIYISTNSAHQFPFLYIVANTCCVFDDNLSDRYEIVSYCGFDLHILDD